MVITKPGHTIVPRKLFSNEVDSSETRRSQRVIPKRTNRQLIMLDKLNSTELDELLGEGPSTSVRKDSSILAKKKTGEAALAQGLQEISSKAIATKDIFRPANSQEKETVPDPDSGHTKMSTERERSIMSWLDKSESVIQNDNSKEVAENHDSNEGEDVRPISNTEDLINKADTLPDQTVSNKGLENFQTNSSDLMILNTPVTICTSEKTPTQTCSTCKVILVRLQEMVTLIQSGKAHQEVHNAPQQAQDLNTDELVPLVRGSKVRVPLPMKSNIPLKVKGGDPQDYVNVLMDMLYTEDEMAHMSCDGRTKGTKRVDRDKFDAMLAYVNHKYNKDRYNFDQYLLKDFINGKCYSVRRKLWAREGSNVRPKMQKKVSKKAPNECGESVVVRRRREPARIHASKCKDNHRRGRKHENKQKEVTVNKRIHCRDQEVKQAKKLRYESPENKMTGSGKRNNSPGKSRKDSPTKKSKISKVHEPARKLIPSKESEPPRATKGNKCPKESLMWKNPSDSKRYFSNKNSYSTSPVWEVSDDSDVEEESQSVSNQDSDGDSFEEDDYERNDDD